MFVLLLGGKEKTYFKYLLNLSKHHNPADFGQGRTNHARQHPIFGTFFEQGRAKTKDFNILTFWKTTVTKSLGTCREREKNSDLGCPEDSETSSV